MLRIGSEPSLRSFGRPGKRRGDVHEIIRFFISSFRFFGLFGLFGRSGLSGLFSLFSLFGLSGYKAKGVIQEKR
jgi:hypothetical protein